MIFLSTNDALISKWSGGTTAQLMIFPSFSQYKDRDFDYRISVATIDDEESTFTALPDYDRTLIPLSETISLMNNGENVELKRCELYEFDGNDSVESRGQARDFGIMCRKGICHSNVEILAYEEGEEIPTKADFAYCALGIVEMVEGKYKVASGAAVIIFVNIEYDLKLVEPAEEHKEIWEKAKAEFISYEESSTPFGFSEGKENFEDFLKASREAKNRTEIVFDEEHQIYVSPSVTMFLMGQKENKILGTISCRTLLTEGLRERGGNVGYGIMPSMRRRGYSVKMLSMFLKECRKLGLAAVIVTCSEDNIGSKKAILGNGGVLYGTGVTDEGETYEKYYILIL